jgi:signal transduction histidine kinase
MAARMRGAGIDVVLTTRGSVQALSPVADLNAYRIVQEALTNVVKHAGHANVSVELDFSRDHLSIAVRDDGASVDHRGMVPGHGIIGMRERARLSGGSLTAGPLTGGGYQVLCRLPLEASQVPTRPSVTRVAST